MSIVRFQQLLSQASYGKNDKKWFPKWLRRYVSTRGQAHGTLSVTVAEVTQFCSSLRDHGTPAWQRLQPVRAVEMYRNLVLHAQQPDLHEIRQTLGRLAERERTSGSTDTTRV